MSKQKIPFNVMNRSKELSKLRFPLNLQYFSDPEPPADPEPPVDPPADPPKPGAKTYTQEELEELIKQRVAREKKAAEKAVKEAEKLAKMNEEQKKQYELEKLQQELAEYKKKDAYHALSKEASKILAENEIIADDELLSVVVKETAEDTQAAVQSFIKLVQKHVKAGVKQALAGKPPKVKKDPKVKNPFSKEHFNLTEQAKILKDNPTLAAELKAAAK